MKEYLVELVRGAPTAIHARNVVREYLQARVLAAMQRSGAMIPLAFHGGTALRFLYAIGRYSEDLDFTLEKTSSGYDMETFLAYLRSELRQEGYTIRLKLNDRKTVHAAMVILPGLLNELGLSPHVEETIAVKIEVDTKPPAGSQLATSIVRRYVTLNLQHHDRATLLAGKLHAVLQRPFLKGRDVYDLLWYLSDRSWPLPNLVLLNNAMEQTGWTGPPISADNWRELVRERIDSMRWDNVVSDVRPFIETSAELDLLTRENLDRLLRSNS